MSFRKLFINKKDKLCLDASKKYLDSKDFEFLKKNFFDNNISFIQNYLNVSFLQNTFYPQAYMLKEKNVQKITAINSKIKKNMLKTTYREFSSNAKDIIPKYYAQNIEDCVNVKRAVILSLISDNNINIAIVSDKENSNKNIFLDSLNEIYPIVSVCDANDFLGIKHDNDETQLGAIPKADNGILGLKEFQNISNENLEILNYAIENEVIYIKKGKKSYSAETRFKLIATASSKETRIVSSKPEIINQQVSINKDLFDIIFIVRDIQRKEIQTTQEKQQIYIQEELSKDSYELNSILNKSKKGKINQELNYIKDYLIYTENFSVNLSDRMKKELVSALLNIKEKYDEKKFLKKVEPKELIQVMVRLAKANARLSLRRDVNEEDVKEAQKIIVRSFFAI